MVKNIHENPTASITFNGEKLDVFPQKMRKKAGTSLSQLLFIVLGILANMIRQGKKIQFT